MMLFLWLQSRTCSRWGPYNNSKAKSIFIYKAIKQLFFIPLLQSVLLDGYFFEPLGDSRSFKAIKLCDVAIEVVRHHYYMNIDRYLVNYCRYQVFRIHLWLEFLCPLVEKNLDKIALLMNMGFLSTHNW